MIKINIKKNGEITNSGSFDSQEDVNVWLQHHVSANSFGKSERWVCEDQEDISNALEIRTVIDSPAISEELDEQGNVIQEALPETSHTEYKLAAEYTIEIEDITIQIQTKQESEQARKYLADTDWYILREMDSGVVCPQEIKDLRAAARLKVI